MDQRWVDCPLFNILKVIPVSGSELRHCGYPHRVKVFHHGLLVVQNLDFASGRKKDPQKVNESAWQPC